MGKMPIDRSQSATVDAFLRDELARGNRALRSLAPVVAHFLESDGPSLISDAIIARLRGMMSDLADQLLRVSGVNRENSAEFSERKAQLCTAMAVEKQLIDHLYAVALEGHLTERLHREARVDPALSPLMQELMASNTEEVAELAMAGLAAQSRFFQNIQRMDLPINELPQDILAIVLERFQSVHIGFDEAELANVLTAIKGTYDEGTSRIGLYARLARSMPDGAIAGLDLEHAGLALFASSLASLTKRPREHIIFACHEAQSVRLALILAAAGQTRGDVEAQIALLGASTALPEDVMQLSQADALSFLRDLSEA